MPVKKRREKSRVLDEWCRAELLAGPCLLAGLGYYTYEGSHGKDGCDTLRMKQDWERHGQRLTAEWEAEFPGTKPYAWHKFDAPKPKGESQASYMNRITRTFNLGTCSPKEHEPDSGARH